MKEIMKLVCVSIALLSSMIGSANAEENGSNIIYIGAGSAKTASPTEAGHTPGTIGYLNISDTRDSIFGFDIAGEGTMLDSTWGQYNSLAQATSYNIIYGTNLSKSETTRFDVGFLAGMVEETSSCKASYLGYQCYADESPDTSYKFNYGVIATLTYKQIMLGLRATGKSTQALIGYRF